jgi:hypothetical protein
LRIYYWRKYVKQNQLKKKKTMNYVDIVIISDYIFNVIVTRNVTVCKLPVTCFESVELLFDTQILEWKLKKKNTHQKNNHHTIASPIAL